MTIDPDSIRPRRTRPLTDAEDIPLGKFWSKMVVIASSLTTAMSGLLCLSQWVWTFGYFLSPENPLRYEYLAGVNLSLYYGIFLWGPTWFFSESESIPPFLRRVARATIIVSVAGPLILMFLISPLFL